MYHFGLAVTQVLEFHNLTMMGLNLCYEKVCISNKLYQVRHFKKQRKQGTNKSFLTPNIDVDFCPKASTNELSGTNAFHLPLEFTV